MPYREKRTSSDDLVPKIATGVVMGGLVLLGIVYIHDKIQERRALHELNQFTAQMAAEATKAEEQARWAAYRANERRDAIAARAAQQREVEFQASRLADDERCMSGRLLKRTTNGWVQITGQEASLNCSR